MTEYYVIERNDYNRIKKLNMLHNVETFWEDVRKLTSNIKSEHSLKRWQILSEARYGELVQAKKSFYED